MKQIFKIAFGVALGLVIAGAVYFSLAMASFSFLFNKATEPLAATARHNQETQLRIEAERTRQRQLELQTEREKRAATELQARLASEKEEAWKKSYTVPNECADYTRNRDMIECANQYMRTRKQFEQEWTRKTAMRNER